MSSYEGLGLGMPGTRTPAHLSSECWGKKLVPRTGCGSVVPGVLSMWKALGLVLSTKRKKSVPPSTITYIAHFVPGPMAGTGDPNQVVMCCSRLVGEKLYLLTRPVQQRGTGICHIPAVHYPQRAQSC